MTSLSKTQIVLSSPELCPGKRPHHQGIRTVKSALFWCNWQWGRGRKAQSRSHPYMLVWSGTSTGSDFENEHPLPAPGRLTLRWPLGVARSNGSLRRMEGFLSLRLRNQLQAHACWWGRRWMAGCPGGGQHSPLQSPTGRIRRGGCGQSHCCCWTSWSDWKAESDICFQQINCWSGQAAVVGRNGQILARHH